MKFEWDDNKNKSNQNKHGIDFNKIKEVFDDSNRIESEDARKNYGEKRYITIGKVKNVILTVIYTTRKTITRLISARRSNKKERTNYNSRQK